MEKLIYALQDDEGWQLWNESEVGKLAMMQMLNEIRQSVSNIEHDIMQMILQLKAYERFDEIKSLIALRLSQLTG